MSLRLFIVFSLVSRLAVAGSAAPGDRYLTYSGVATVRHTTDFLYGEHHVMLYRDGRLAERGVLYTCRDGSPFARKTVNYVDALAPDFSLENVSDGMREGIRTIPVETGRRVFFRPTAHDPEKSGPLPHVPGLVADAGFDEFVQSHWDELLKGRPIEMRFLVPSRLDDYGFEVEHLRSESIKGTPTEVFRLKLSGIWGWFLPGIDVYYSAAEHVLVRYDGVSDLRDMDGNNFKATIEFSPQDRKPATEQAMQELRQARLEPCR
jgi:hypothetical protein